MLWEAGAMSSILDEAANRHRMDAERTRLALSGVLGEEAKIYALIDEAAQAVIDDAVRVARERQEAVLMFGLPTTPSHYAFTSPVMEALPRTPRAAGHRITGKRAQRRMSKPWAGRRA